MKQNDSRRKIIIMQPDRKKGQIISSKVAVLENGGKENVRKASSTYKLIKRELE